MASIFKDILQKLKIGSEKCVAVCEALTGRRVGEKTVRLSQRRPVLMQEDTNDWLPYPPTSTFERLSKGGSASCPVTMSALF